MSSKHYDIAIIGGSLAARIAATLLAKQGRRVLFIRRSEARAPAWFHSSLFLEKLLGVLGGRSCFVAQRPIQVFSARSRVTICNDIPIEAELTREFGTSGLPVSQWLAELNNQGVLLEELFWENGGLPWPALKASARFRLLCLRRRVNMPRMEQPVRQELEQFTPPARDFLTDLLQGLSLTDISHLGYARAAMLWTQALRPENLKEPDFSIVLSKRYDQFHGAKAELDDLDGLGFDGTRWTGGRFKSGGRFTADTFLLGDKRWIGLFNASGKAGLPDLAPTPATRRAVDLRGQVSNLLETRVICGGKRPMRIAIDEHDDELQGLILSAPETTDEEVRQQLEAVLPFAKYRLTQETQFEAQTTEGEPATRLTNLPLRIAANLYCADRTALLPDMGAAGAALLAWTISANLSKGGNGLK